MTSASISITGLSASDVVPGNYMEVAFAQGDASLGSATYAALIIANKASTGSATADTVVYSQTSTPPLSTEADAIAIFGAGSPAHRMWRQFVSVNKTTPVYVICPAESAGTAASGTVTYATAPTGAGVARLTVGENYVEYSYTAADTVTTIAAALVLLANAQVNWPVTAGNSAGVVTLTWKTKGPQGNWGRISGGVTGGTAITASPAVPTFLTSGATADSYTTTLATILPSRFYYIVTEASSVSGASTQTSAVATQIGSQALPINGIRQRLFNGSVDTLANTTTFAVALNNARAEVQWLQNSDRPPEELAAYCAGVYALEEQGINFRCNFDSYGSDAATQANWNVKAPLSGTQPTRANLVTALNNGITPIGVNANKSTYLVSRITTRSLTSGVADYRIRDAHKVTVMDRLADDLQAKFTLQFSGKKIGNDPVGNDRIPSADVVTPRAVKAAIYKVLDEYEANDLIENKAATVAALVVQREVGPTTRMTVRLPIDTVDCLHQIGTLALQQG